MAWARHGHGMASVNQTRPHRVNQMGKTHSKPLAARHGRERHAMCESAFSVSSVPTNLVTTFHVHTSATCAFRTKGLFNPAKGVTRELPVSWLAVDWRYALLPLVMRGCGIPMV